MTPATPAPSRIGLHHARLILRSLWLPVFSAGAVSVFFAQTAPLPPSTLSQTAKDEAAIVLRPFEVTATSDTGCEGYRDNGRRIQCKHFKNLFVSREWWTLAPDYGHPFVTAGYGTLSPTIMDYVGAAINPAGTLGMAYCPKAATITVDLAKFSAPVTARWFDPTNGRFSDWVEGSHFANRGTHEFASPGPNIAGCEDWVLVLETRPPARESTEAELEILP